MIEELSLIRMASSLARHATARQKVVAENIANADTPGYRAREVKSFDQYVKESFTPRATRSEHVTSSPLQRSSFRTEIVPDNSVQASANGNSVSLEDEMVKSVETRGQHNLALTVYRKTVDLLRISMGRA